MQENKAFLFLFNKNHITIARLKYSKNYFVFNFKITKKYIHKIEVNILVYI